MKNKILAIAFFLLLPVYQAHAIELTLGQSSITIKPGDTQSVSLINSGDTEDRYQMSFEKGYQSWMRVYNDDNNYTKGHIKLSPPASINGTFEIVLKACRVLSTSECDTAKLIVTVQNETSPLQISIDNFMVKAKEAFEKPILLSGGNPPYQATVNGTFSNGDKPFVDATSKIIRCLGYSACSVPSVNSDQKFEFTATIKDSSNTEAFDTFTITVSKDPQENVPWIPYSFYVTAKSTSEIQIVWSTDENVSYYQLYRGSTFIKKLSLSKYLDTNLNANTKYCYKVKACNSGGYCSEFTEMTCATTFNENEPPEYIFGNVYPSQDFEGEFFKFSNQWKDPENDVLDVFMRYRKQGTSNWSEIIELNKNGANFEKSIQFNIPGIYEYAFKALDDDHDNVIWRYAGTLTVKELPDVIQQPEIKLSSVFIKPEKPITVTGNYFGSGNYVKIIINAPSGTLDSLEKQTDQKGSVEHIINYNSGMPNGDYDIFIQHSDSSLYATAGFSVDEFIRKRLQIVSPMESGLFISGNPIPVAWYDDIVEDACPDLKNICYKIYYSENKGLSWIFFKETCYSALPNNGIKFQDKISINKTGEFLIKIQDVCNPSRFALSLPFHVKDNVLSQLNVEFLWDKSFPEPEVKPVGVAAEGVSRIIVKLKNLSSKEIKKIEVELSDPENGLQNKEMLGKLFITKTIDEYSNEANEASQIKILDDRSDRSEYNYWYVSPDDFSADSLNEFHNKSIRKVLINFTVTYADSVVEKISKEILITRPPLMLVHGLGGSTHTWDSFYYNGIKFIDDPRFLVKKAVEIDPKSSFFINAGILMTVPGSFKNYNSSSIYYLIESIRNLGYACNQLYYVGHSMAGNICRTMTSGKLKNMYFMDNPLNHFYYSSYGKGYVNRLISLDSPHNGSIVANVVEGSLKYINENYILGNALIAHYANSPNGFMSNFIELYSVGGFLNKSKYKLTSAMQNLRAIGGVALPETMIKNHLIAGDIVSGDYSLPEIPQELINFVSRLDSFTQYFDHVYDEFMKRYSGEHLSDLKKIGKKLNTAQRILNFIKFLIKSYSSADFLMNSDFIVSVESQLAGQPRDTSNVHVFDNIFHTDMPFVTSVLESTEVGDHVDKLLHTSLQSNLFSDTIPATPPQPTKRIARAIAEDMTMPTSENNSLIEIFQPSANSEFNVGDRISVQIQLNQITNLLYAKIYFQNKSYMFSDISDEIILTDIPVTGDFTGSIPLEALAIYNNQDESTISAFQSITLTINPNETLQSITVWPKSVQIAKDQKVNPSIQANYNSFTSRIAMNNPEISIQIDDPQIAVFDEQSLSFKGINKGQTKASIKYKNETDTIFIKTLPSPDEPLLGISPEILNVSYASGIDYFTVSSNQPITWTALSNSSWLTVFRQDLGSGMFGVKYGSNEGQERQGNIEVRFGDQKKTVSVVQGIAPEEFAGEVKILPDDGATNYNFGNAVAIDGDYAIVGSYADDSNGTNSGSAYIFKRESLTWVQQAKLVADDVAEQDYFGSSVSLDNGYAIVGAKYDDDNGSNSGSSYIFKREGSNWIQQQKLIANDGEKDDYFGEKVSISGDYAIIGSRWDDDKGSNSGSAYIFKREGLDWIQQAKLLADDGAKDDLFGGSVSIDGDYAIIGAHNDDKGTNSGSAYIFKKEDSSWFQQEKLLANDGTTADYFGCAVSISGDFAIVGAYHDDDKGSGSGSAYIFNREGASWQQNSKIVANDGATSDSFGYAVCISSDYAIVGSQYNDDNGTSTGSAYIFKHNGEQWNQIDKLIGTDSLLYDYFGYAVGISDNTAIIGTPHHDKNGDSSGAAYIYDNISKPSNKPILTITPHQRPAPNFEGTTTFELQNTGSGVMNWTVASEDSWLSIEGNKTGTGDATITVKYEKNLEDARTGRIVFSAENARNSFTAEVKQNTGLADEVKIVPDDGASGDYFGYAVSIDGDYAIVGANYDDDKGVNSGSAYIYKKVGNSWIMQEKIVPDDGASSDYFGQAVSNNGGYAIIGAYGDDDKGSSSGSAYIYKRDGSTWTQQAKLLAKDGEADDFFGAKVFIHNSYAIVGAYGNDDDGSKSGSAYIFKRDGSTWIQQAKLVAEDGAEQDIFGVSVSLSGDYAAVGSYLDDDKGSKSGSVYIFKKEGSSWAQQTKLLANDGAANDYFGYAVSLDGDYLIVGAYYDDDKASNSGSAYIFQRQGEIWSQKSKLTAIDGNANDYFGFSVSISKNFAVVGSYRKKYIETASGGAYLFKQVGDTWKQVAKLHASDASTDEYFGYAVSISDNYAIIGSYGDDDKGGNSGSAYIYSINSGIQLSMESQSANFGTEISVPVKIINTNISVRGMEVIVAFDPEVLQAKKILKHADISENDYYFMENTTYEEGKLYFSITAKTENPLIINGVLANITFDVVGNAGESSALNFIKTEINAGNVEVDSQYNAEITIEGLEISGNIVYYQKNTPVPDVLITLAGNDNYTTTTDNAGNYQFIHIPPGQYNLTLSKDNDLNGLSQMDASRILRQLARLLEPPFDNNTLQAAEADLDNKVSPLDASSVWIYDTKFQHSQPACLQDKPPCINWIFQDHKSQTGFQTHFSKTISLTSNILNGNYTAFRLGDVTGDWTTASNNSKQKRNNSNNIIDMTIKESTDFSVAIALSQEQTIEGMGIMIEYDTNQLTFINAELSGGILENKDYDMTISPYENDIYFGIRATKDLYSGKGILVNMHFKTKETAINPANIVLKSFTCNETNVSGKLVVENEEGDKVNINIDPFTLKDVIKVLKTLSGME